MTRVITALDAGAWSPCTPVEFDRDLEIEFRTWLKLEQMRMVTVWRPEMLKMEKPSKVSFSDASIFAWGIVYFDKEGNRRRYTQYIPEEFIDQPIHIKEVLGIIQMLENDPKEFTECTIVHYCDNEGVVLGYKNLGVTSFELNKWITHLYELLHKLGSIMR